MTLRTAAILEAVIKEFIETGAPVSSRSLAKKYNWNIKDATVRNELHALTEGNYLEQPHTSAGRVPTDRGYQFLVRRIGTRFAAGEKNSYARSARALIEEFSKGYFDDFVDNFAQELSVLGVGYAPSGRAVYKSGLDELFGRLAEDGWFTDFKEACGIIQDFERLDERMDVLMDFLTGEEPRVFIGRSPITKSKNLSVIAEVLSVGSGKFLFAAVGPKRMDYERGLNLFMTLKERIKE